MAVDFSKILASQSETIEKPKALPVGTYLCSNLKLPEFKGLGKEETPAAVFTYTVLIPQEDVDPDALKEFGEVKGKTLRHTLFMTEASLFRTKEAILAGFNIEEEGKTLGQIFNETINKQILVTVKHTPNQQGTDMFAEAEKIAAV